VTSRVRFGAAFCVGILLAVAPALPLPAAPASTSSLITRGGDGEIRISTGWGRYVIVDTGGDNAWVGSEQQYGKLRSAVLAKRLRPAVGASRTFRESQVGSANDVHVMVEGNSYAVRVDSIRLDGISPTVEFDTRVTGVGAASLRAVSVNWIQASNAGVDCLIVDAGTGNAVAATNPLEVQDEWRNATFAIPAPWLTRRVFLVFVSHGLTPAAVTIPSFVVADWNLERVRGDESAMKSRKRLLAIEPGLARCPPDCPGAIRTKQRVLPMERPVAVASPGPAANERDVVTPSGIAIRVRTARTEAERMRGLSGAAAPGPHHGMLFVFDGDGPRPMWLKDVPFALDFVFVRADGTVTGVVTLSGSPSGTADGQVPRISGFGTYVFALPPGEAVRDGFVTGQRAAIVR
jgi:uncharacterized membrane protein (UPF0127 family)